MKNPILFCVATGMVLVPLAAANAQDSHAPAPPAPGTVNSRDVMNANRERDAAYNQLLGRGVKATDKDRETGKARHPVPATAADIKAGAEVRDVKGVPVGTIATLSSNEIVMDPSQIVIDTGHTKIGVPLTAFGKDDKGLMLSITAEKFNQLVAQVRASEAQTK